MPTALPAPSGESFLVDNIEIFPTNAAQNASLVRASATEEPESYDGVSGIMSIAENNGQGIRAAFTLRNNLYFVKERSMYVTADRRRQRAGAVGASRKCRTKWARLRRTAWASGEEWVVIAGRSGLYFFDGSEPVKLSQEIQPTWDAINWQYGHRIWVQVDTRAQAHSRRRADGLGHAAESDSDARLHRGLQDPLVAMLFARRNARGNGRRGLLPRIPAG